jgi:hypothetical protein
VARRPASSASATAVWSAFFAHPRSYRSSHRQRYILAPTAAKPKNPYQRLAVAPHQSVFPDIQLYLVQPITSHRSQSMQPVLHEINVQ